MAYVLHNSRGQTTEYPCKVRGKLGEWVEWCDGETYASWRRVAVAVRAWVIRSAAKWGTANKATRDALARWLRAWGTDFQSSAISIGVPDPDVSGLRWPQPDADFGTPDWFKVELSTVNPLSDYALEGFTLLRGAGVEPDGSVLAYVGKGSAEGDALPWLKLIGGAALLGALAWGGMYAYRKFGENTLDVDDEDGEEDQ